MTRWWFVLVLLVGCATAPPPEPIDVPEIEMPRPAPAVTEEPAPVEAGPATVPAVTEEALMQLLGTGDPATGLGSGEGFGSPAGIGRIRTGTPLKASLGRDEITSAIMSKLTEIRHCYDKALGADASVSGTVKVRFTIGTDGKVSSAEAVTSVEVGFDACVVGVIETIQFPKPHGGPAVVTYPFVFASQ